MGKNSLTCALSCSLFFIYVCARISNTAYKICKYGIDKINVMVVGLLTTTPNYYSAKRLCARENKNMQLLAPQLSLCATAATGYNAWLNHDHALPDVRSVSNIGPISYLNPPRAFHVICYQLGKCIRQ